ncbi:MAG: fimbria/pilus outer membrane usher protein, partial [Caulobacterales bacterium]
SAARISLSIPLGRDLSSSASVDTRRGGRLYRAGFQGATRSNNIDWRARMSAGRIERYDLGAIMRSNAGETAMHASRVDNHNGVRIGHAGSIGLIEGQRFSGRTIEGAFALVDAGAPNVAISRNHFDLGRTNARGVLLATNLRPYEINTISIDPDDLPLDRAPANADRRIAPREGAGTLLKFEEAAARVIDTIARLMDGTPAPYGGMLVREKDGERFPVGRDGLVTLIGDEPGDDYELNGQIPCESMRVGPSVEIRCAS